MKEPRWLELWIVLDFHAEQLALFGRERTGEPVEQCADGFLHAREGRLEVVPNGEHRLRAVEQGLVDPLLHLVERATQPQPGKVFAFPRTTTATPVAAKPAVTVSDPAPVMEEEAEDETLELTEEIESGDELLLDSDDVLTAPVGSAPIAPRSLLRRPGSSPVATAEGVRGFLATASFTG